MLIYTAVGPRSVDDRDVNVLGGYCNATVITVGGEEISGCALTAAIDKIEREIVENLLPPAA